MNKQTTIEYTFTAREITRILTDYIKTHEGSLVGSVVSVDPMQKCIEPPSNDGPLDTLDTLIYEFDGIRVIMRKGK